VFALLALVAIVFAFGLGYFIARGNRTPASGPPQPAAPVPVLEIAAPVPISAPVPEPAPAPLSAPPATDTAVAERARLIRSFEGEAAALRRSLAGRDAALAQLVDFAAERRRQFEALAAARADTARYRQIIVDLENNAPPPLLGGPGAPDDLKLIVGVGPVLERMLYQLGVTTYRQIARWTEREIDEFDARMQEFPGRIRRDGWVTQARALHQSKYGADVPARDRA
jgi:predicted flap endonuclease-1-like 5' DNA nuclease